MMGLWWLVDKGDGDGCGEGVELGCEIELFVWGWMSIFDWIDYIIGLFEILLSWVLVFFLFCVGMVCVCVKGGLGLFDSV